MPDPFSAFRKSFAILRRDGLRALLRRARERLWEREEIVLLERDLGSPPQARAARIEAEFSWASADQLSLLCPPDFDIGPRLLLEARRWLERGDRCLIGFSGGAPVCYLWVSFSLRELPGLRWPVGPRQAYIYKTFTRESFRGRGLNQAGLAAILLRAFELGARRAFIDVNRANVASLRAIHGAGFTESGVFHVYRIGRRRRARVGRRLFRRVAVPSAPEPHEPCCA